MCTYTTPINQSQRYNDIYSAISNKRHFYAQNIYISVPQSAFSVILPLVHPGRFQAN